MTSINYTRAAVDARLRRASTESAATTSATPRVPMTRDGIDLRLRQASELSRTCRQLQQLGRSL